MTTLSKKIVMEFPLFDVIWSRAYTELDQADEIYFLGYSFPSTDINTLYFFSQFQEKITKICIFHDKLKFEDSKKRISDYLKELKDETIVNEDAMDFLIKTIDDIKSSNHSN